MIGRKVSHYTILKKIGEGGMGEIYLAVDTKLGRKVALKFLPKKLLENEEARERFKREARAAAALNHPNIVTIHEIDEFEELIYIVMEYIEGETLGDRLEGGELDLEGETVPIQVMQLDDILSIILEVGKGLAKAHRAGIIHRDIKLDNILISRDGMVKILDFGLAKLKGTGDLTEESVAMGTAYYMAPEQLRGEGADHRTDIWALGVVMYVLASGQLPFMGKSAIEAIYTIMKKEPEPLLNLNKTIPREFERIVKRCLQKDPRRRYQDVSDLIADLVKLKNSHPSAGAETGKHFGIVLDFFRKLSPRITVPVLTLGLGLIVTLLFPAEVLKIKKWLGFEIIPSEKNLILLPFQGEGSTADKTFCGGLMERVTDKLKYFEQIDKNLLVILSKNIHTRDIRSAGDAHRFFGVNLVIAGNIKREKDLVHLTIKVVDTRKQRTLDSRVISKHISDLVDFQEDVVIEIIGMLEVEITPQIRKRLSVGGTDRSGAYRFYLQGRGHLLDYKKKENIDTAIDFFDRAIKIDSDYALAYSGLAEGYWRKFQLKKEMCWLEKAEKYCRQALDIDGRLVCACITLGRIYKLMGKNDESIRIFRDALKIEPCNVEAFRSVARVHEAQGKFDEAEKIYQEIARLRPNDFNVQNYLGAFYYRQSRWQDALAAFQETVRLNPHYVGGLSNLGSLYFSLRRWRDAQHIFERLLLVIPTYETYSNLGTIYFYEGLYRDAAEMYKKALEEKDIDYQVWGNLAESFYWTPGERDQARPYYRRAISLAEKELQGKPDDPVVISFLASYHGRLGDRSRTLSLLERLEKLKNLTPGVLFLMADAYEQVKKRDHALRWIQAALDRGYSLAEIEHNPALFNLRSDQRFREFLVTREESRQVSDASLPAD